MIEYTYLLPFLGNQSPLKKLENFKQLEYAHNFNNISNNNDDNSFYGLIESVKNKGARKGSPA